MKAAIDAHVALSDLRGSTRSIPDDGILVRALALQEARVSSEIEMIVTTSYELYRALSQEEEVTDPQTKEVLRYSDSVWLGYGHLKAGRSMDVPLFEQLATTILKRSTRIRDGQGTRVGDAKTGKIIYTPPVGAKLITEMLNNLIQYLRGAKEVDPLIRMCVAHYQFEAIHPFPDSNGRVGRVLNSLYLVEQKLLDKPILYLSRAIIDDKHSYYRGIRKVTEEGA